MTSLRRFRLTLLIQARCSPGNYSSDVQISMPGHRRETSSAAVRFALSSIQLMLSSGWSLRTLVSILGFAVVIWLALLPVVPSSLRLSDGDVSTRTIRAPHDISFTSKALTQKRQAEASEAIKDSF